MDTIVNTVKGQKVDLTKTNPGLNMIKVGLGWDVGDNHDLLDEMRTFPNGQHDDVIDSLAMQLHNARAPFRANRLLSDSKEVNIAI